MAIVNILCNLKAKTLQARVNKIQKLINIIFL